MTIDQLLYEIESAPERVHTFPISFEQAKSLARIVRAADKMRHRIFCTAHRIAVSTDAANAARQYGKVRGGE